MAIILIFTLCLISGPVGQSQVIGYAGGRVLILSKLIWDLDNPKHICKMKEGHCDRIINGNSQSNVYTDRFMLFRNSEGLLRVLITNLKQQDAGKYVIGVGDQGTETVDLDVRTNSSFGGPKILTSVQGQSISIACNYPLEFNDFKKLIYKEDSDNLVKNILEFTELTQEGRFSISEDRNAKVLRLIISDAREADGGVYICGAENVKLPVLYYSFFPDTKLLITDSVSLISITVCVCVALLLFGGLALTCALIYKRAQGSARSSKRRIITNEQVPTVYENVLADLLSYTNLNVSRTPNHQKQDSFTSQSDPPYSNLDPIYDQSSSGYSPPANATNQSQSHYQSLNPLTKTSSIYHTLQF